jgi:hypothetical protein
MSRRTGIFSLLVAQTVGLCAGSARGRQIEWWPYDRLFKAADLIIIVEPMLVRDALEIDTTKLIPKKWDYLVPVVSTLKVKYVVKGDYKDQRLDLVHFRLKEGTQIGNGPLLVKFSKGPIRIEGPGWGASFNTHPDYMLFLKKTKDGRLEFVSGYYDPKLSVKHVMDPLP